MDAHSVMHRRAESRVGVAVASGGLSRTESRTMRVRSARDVGRVDVDRYIALAVLAGAGLVTLAWTSLLTSLFVSALHWTLG